VDDCLLVWDDYGLIDKLSFCKTLCILFCIERIREWENIPLLYNKFTLRFQYMPFCIVKDALLQCKRASFTPQKGVFCNVKGHLLRAYL
jgi:hypothetical protein